MRVTSIFKTREGAEDLDRRPCNSLFLPIPHPHLDPNPLPLLACKH
jgi:hypothetical protein